MLAMGGILHAGAVCIKLSPTTKFYPNSLKQPSHGRRWDCGLGVPGCTVRWQHPQSNVLNSQYERPESGPVAFLSY